MTHPTPRRAKGDETIELLGLINGHDLAVAYHRAHPAEPMPPLIVYRPQVTGRGYVSAAYQVYVAGEKTEDGKGWWGDYGKKTFVVRGDDGRNQALADAISWCNDRYGLTEWEPVRRLRVSGALAPKRVVDWYMAELAEARKTGPRDLTGRLT